LRHDYEDERCYGGKKDVLHGVLSLIDSTSRATRGRDRWRERTAAWCRYLEAHARQLDATVTDRAQVAAALLASRMARGRLASPFTAREVYRNDWAGLTEPRVVGEALECLLELGWIRPEAVVVRDGGRPTVRAERNPDVLPVV
jgi:hypothetical protein